ncbi:MAG: hypothetical protein WDO74_17030 [Pseudomonadota bacterium]
MTIKDTRNAVKPRTGDPREVIKKTYVPTKPPLAAPPQPVQSGAAATPPVKQGK